MKFTIIGAGNGGQSMAAHLTFLGEDVILYDIQEGLIDDIKREGGIKAEGVMEGFAQVKATTDLKEAMNNTDVIMVTTTGTAHKHVARSIAPFLTDGQIIMIFPGYWGALEFRNIFKELGIKKDVYQQFIVTDSVLTTTLNNCNPMFHVPILLFNAGRIESSNEFFFYPDGATPSVVNVIEQLEQERLEIGKTLNIKLSTCQDLLSRFYQLDEEHL